MTYGRKMPRRVNTCKKNRRCLLTEVANGLLFCSQCTVRGYKISPGSVVPPRSCCVSVAFCGYFRSQRHSKPCSGQTCWKCEYDRNITNTHRIIGTFWIARDSVPPRTNSDLKIEESFVSQRLFQFSFWVLRYLRYLFCSISPGEIGNMPLFVLNCIEDPLPFDEHFQDQITNCFATKWCSKDLKKRTCRPKIAVQ